MVFNSSMEIVTRRKDRGLVSHRGHVRRRSWNMPTFTRHGQIRQEAHQLARLPKMAVKRPERPDPVDAPRVVNTQQIPLKAGIPQGEPSLCLFGAAERLLGCPGRLWERFGGGRRVDCARTGWMRGGRRWMRHGMVWKHIRADWDTQPVSENFPNVLDDEDVRLENEHEENRFRFEVCSGRLKIFSCNQLKVE